VGDWLEVTQGPAAGTRLEIDDELAVGRLETAPADLGGDRELSRRHARFWRAAGGQLLVEDLGSANGTFVNGNRIDQPILLTGGDSVSLGGTTLVVREDKPTRVRAEPAMAAPAAATAPPPLAPPAAPEAPPGREAPRPERAVVVLAALLVLAVAGLIVSLVTRGGGSPKRVLTSVPAVAPIFPVTGLKFSGQVATFKVGSAHNAVAATIDWGDGTAPTPGTVGRAVAGANGVYARTVSGSHTYARVATYAVNVTVKASPADSQSGDNLAVVTNCFCVARLPTFSRSVDLGPVSGHVRVKPAGSDAFEPLTAPREVPVGSHLDTTNGSVVVMAGTATAGKIMGGEFDGGVFQLLQPHTSGGLVQLDLQGANTANCPSGQSSQTKLSAGVLALLHASVNGSFRTRGRYSAGTVRGTEWTTAEQCNGTLTRVQRGVVDVKDFRTGATAAVSAGESHLARAG
jgi:pSer/pThr/pTyr-binding forkhead associated (FHA) protein